MLINKPTLEAIFINMKTTFLNAFDAAPSQWARIAMLVPSSVKQHDYAWLSTFPKMRKWISEKVIKSLAAYKYSIINDDWETTIEVDRNDIEDDNLGIYAPQAQMAGYSAKQLPDEIVSDLVNNGFTSLCYDGKAFFATNHPVAGASVSNKASGGSSPLSIATLAAAQASYGAGRVALRKMKDEEGRPLNIMPNILYVPPALEDTARALLTVDRLEDGKANPYKGTAELIVDARLTSDTAWFLMDTTKPIKPFIYQERKAPVFVEQTNPQADDVFMRKKFKFGAEARGAGGYGFWQLVYGSVGA
ncbi:MAG TPA: Mu-like prophage major head subunit gpT family protein [Candidatus Wunengus sp. YC60]|uniref:Mu-like prophage major head subunit gpT family protein n=1 Tax=Candidatus Wunengus sp. YC60 TaxID=3367697 RepID=UPI004028B5C6